MGVSTTAIIGQRLLRKGVQSTTAGNQLEYHAWFEPSSGEPANHQHGRDNTPHDSDRFSYERDLRNTSAASAPRLPSPSVTDEVDVAIGIARTTTTTANDRPPPPNAARALARAIARYREFS